MRRYWLTTISLLIGALLVLLPLTAINSGEASTAAKAVLIPTTIAVGVAALAGLWGLRAGRFGEATCLSLVGVGLAVFGLGFFWMFLIPTALAAVVFWFGIVKRGLVTELRSISGA
jgi:hypothetical protein